MGKKQASEPRVLRQFKLRPSVVDRAHDAVYWTNEDAKKGAAKPVTLGDLVENGIEREVRRLEKVRKEPFPNREGDIPRHRPKGAKDRGPRKANAA